MRQLLYTSTSTSPAIGDHLSTILLQSLRNNPGQGLTGLLWTDGARFLQVLEGEHEAVREMFDRIRDDPRHNAVVVLYDRSITVRTFGKWSMALLDDGDDRIGEALKTTDPVVRGTFQDLIQARRRAA